VQVALSKNEPQTAETAFFEWEKREQQQSPSATEDSGGEVRVSFALVSIAYSRIPISIRLY
jgi:hypothetical protein